MGAVLKLLNYAATLHVGRCFANLFIRGKISTLAKREIRQIQSFSMFSVSYDALEVIYVRDLLTDSILAVTLLI